MNIDVGYRYLKLGDIIGAADSTGSFTTWKDISAQEIRVGVRYLLD
jgi:opacity protein-like surface antigen